MDRDLVLHTETPYKKGDILMLSTLMPFNRIASFFNIHRRLDFICTADSEPCEGYYNTTIKGFMYVYYINKKYKIWTKYK